MGGTNFVDLRCFKVGWKPLLAPAARLAGLSTAGFRPWVDRLLETGLDPEFILLVLVLVLILVLVLVLVLVLILIIYNPFLF